MKVAIKFDRFLDEEDGLELVFAPKQMLMDVYIYERDLLPHLEVFETEWITRPEDELFWVYRQGTLIDIDRLRDVYVVQAKTADLDAIAVSIENYHHVPTLLFTEVYKWTGLTNELISNHRTYDDMYALYGSIVQQRAAGY